MLKDLEGIKKVLEFDRVNARFEDKLYLVNAILISYVFLLKAYFIQKKYFSLNLGNQEKLNRKYELTSCVSKQFNGMHPVLAINQNNRRKDFVPVYIFIDCATRLKLFNYYYFSINLRSTFISIYLTLT